MSGACSDCGHDDCQCEAVTYVAPMSRREEVEAKIKKFEILGLTSHLNSLDALARTLADEVDARDAIIDKLLAMLEPGKPPVVATGEKPPFHDYASELENFTAWKTKRELHARACEIAGRVK